MVALLTALALLSQASIQLGVNSDGVSVVRVVDGGTGRVAVYVASLKNSQPILGDTRTVGNDLIFTPRYPLQSEQSYRVEFIGSAALSKTLIVPNAVASARNSIEQVYPSGNILPANQLKLYVQFSAPMSRGVA